MAIAVPIRALASETPPVDSVDTAAREAFKKGVEAFQQRQFEIAETHLTKVPELGSYLSFYKHWYLGEAYLEQNKFEEAEPEFLKVMQGPASTELKYQAQFLLGETALRQKKYTEAIARLVPLEKKWRRSYRLPEVLYRLMVSQLKLGNIRRACEDARKLYSLYPAHSSVLHWGSDLGKVEIDGKPLPCAQAQEDFTKRVRSLQWSGESDKAQREITQLISMQPEGAPRLALDLTLAGFLVNEGSVDDALNLLIRYYPQQKSNMNYLMLLGKAAARSGEYQTAVGAYERAYGLSKHSKKGREALYQAAYLSYQFQDYDGAVRKFQQFAKANPRSGLARDAQWHLAWLQYLRNDFKGALERFQQVAKQAQVGRRRASDALQERLAYWTGMAHLRLKQWDQARSAFDSIVAKNQYSYYGLAAQARLEMVKPKIEQLRAASTRVPSALKIQASPAEASAATAEEERESEEDIAESEEASPEAPGTEEDVVDEEKMQASSFKDPAMRQRIDVAEQLIKLGIPDLARWELWEVERRTSNPQYLRMLISAYEGIGSYNRSASIAELSFAKEREAQGLDGGRGLWQSAFPEAYKPLVSRHAQSFGAAPEWIWSIMRAESVYKADVISPVGAKGLMQLMPYTANQLSRLGGEGPVEPGDLLKPDVNIRLGAQYLARLGTKFKGQLPLVAAAYNAGPHRVESWLVNFGHLETDEFIEHIPFLETRNYVKKVVRNHTFYRRIYAKDVKPVDYLAKTLGVPIPARAATRESWDSL